MASLFVEQRDGRQALAPSRRARERRGVWKRARRAVLPVLGVALLLAAWQWAAAGPVPVLPLASDTALTFLGMLATAEFWTATWDTLGTAMLGFAVASAIGIALGLFAGLNAYVFRASKVAIEVAKPIPAIVILPLMVLQLGASQSMVLALIMWALIPLLAVTTAAGVGDVDPLLLETAGSYRLRHVAKLRSVVLPSALPFIATGLRIGASLAIVIAVVGEIVGGAPGLGRQLEVYRQAGLPQTVFAYVIALGLLGVAIYYLLLALERRVLRWHESYRSSVKTGALGRRLSAAWAGAADRFWASRAGIHVEDIGVAAAKRRTARTANAPRKVRQVRSSSSGRGLVLQLVQVGVPIVLLVWWWFASSTSTSPFYPSLSTILEHFREMWIFDHFASDVVPSLSNFIGGFVLSVVLGITLGLVVARLHWLDQMLDPLITFFRSIPAVAFIPLLITLVGFGPSMRVASIVLAAIFPVLIATVDGVRSIDGTLGEVARSYRVSSIRRLFSIYLPAATPRIFSGIEIALAISLVVMIASELIGTSFGIGAQVARAQTDLAFADMWAGILLLSLIGLAFSIVFTASRRTILSWYFGARAAARAQ